MKKIMMLGVLSVLILSLAACGARTSLVNMDSKLAKITTSDTYPQKDTGVTLRYWTPLHTNVAASADSMNDIPFHDYLEEETGIKVKFEHPAIGSEAESFNVMLMSDNLPDIFENWSWNSYSGGPQQAIEDGVIISLNDYIDKVCPNIKKILKEHPEYTKDCMTVEGNIYAFPMIRDNEALQTYMTFVVRKDLLDKAGLDIPVTYDDWEKMLYKFKELGVKSPITLDLRNAGLAETSSFTSKFDFIGTFYHDENNAVKFGPYEKAYGDYIKMLKKWYDDGILDTEFSDQSTKRLVSEASNGNIGSMITSIGGNFGSILSSIPAGSDIKFVTTTIPVVNKGEVPMWNQRDFPVVMTRAASISAKSEHKELAARLLDFGYSQDGYYLYNFGKEGVSYEMKKDSSGKEVPTYTANLKDKAQNGGLSLGPAIAKYSRASYFGPFCQSVDYIYQYYQTDVQKEAITKWNSRTLDYKMPRVTYSTEDQQKLNDIITPIDTYREEMTAKLISGKVNISELDTYFSELKRMGIEDATVIVQKAYNEYFNRDTVTFN